MRTIKTFLPVFCGFYNTIFEPNTQDFEDDNNCDYDDFEFRNNDYENHIARECTQIIGANCDFIKSIEFEEVVSPRQYNFTNDSINVKIELNRVVFKRFLNDNKVELNNYLKRRYTSCDGFMSHYPNTFEGWKEETENFTKLDGHYLGSLLDFYFETIDFDSESLYYEIYDTYYIEEFCEMRIGTFEDLSEDRQKEVVQDLIDSEDLDLDFGYNAIIKKSCQDKVELFGGDLIDYLIDYYKELLPLDERYAYE